MARQLPLMEHGPLASALGLNTQSVGAANKQGVKPKSLGAGARVAMNQPWAEVVSGQHKSGMGSVAQSNTDLLGTSPTEVLLHNPGAQGMKQGYIRALGGLDLDHAFVSMQRASDSGGPLRGYDMRIRSYGDHGNPPQKFDSQARDYGLGKEFSLGPNAAAYHFPILSQHLLRSPAANQHDSQYKQDDRISNRVHGQDLSTNGLDPQRKRRFPAVSPLQETWFAKDHGFTEAARPTQRLTSTLEPEDASDQRSNPVMRSPVVPSLIEAPLPALREPPPTRVPLTVASPKLRQELKLAEHKLDADSLRSSGQSIRCPQQSSVLQASKGSTVQSSEKPTSRDPVSCKAPSGAAWSGAKRHDETAFYEELSAPHKQTCDSPRAHRQTRNSQAYYKSSGYDIDTENMNLNDNARAIHSKQRYQSGAQEHASQRRSGKLHSERSLSPGDRYRNQERLSDERQIDESVQNRSYRYGKQGHRDEYRPQNRVNPWLRSRQGHGEHEEDDCRHTKGSFDEKMHRGRKLVEDPYPRKKRGPPSGPERLSGQRPLDWAHGASRRHPSPTEMYYEGSKRHYNEGKDYDIESDGQSCDSARNHRPQLEQRVAFPHQRLRNANMEIASEGPLKAAINKGGQRTMRTTRPHVVSNDSSHSKRDQDTRSFSGYDHRNSRRTDRSAQWKSRSGPDHRREVGLSGGVTEAKEMSQKRHSTERAHPGSARYSNMRATEASHKNRGFKSEGTSQIGSRDQALNNCTPDSQISAHKKTHLKSQTDTIEAKAPFQEEADPFPKNQSWPSKEVTKSSHRSSPREEGRQGQPAAAHGGLNVHDNAESARKAVSPIQQVKTHLRTHPGPYIRNDSASLRPQSQKYAGKGSQSETQSRRKQKTRYSHDVSGRSGNESAKFPPKVTERKTGFHSHQPHEGISETSKAELKSFQSGVPQATHDAEPDAFRGAHGLPGPHKDQSLDRSHRREDFIEVQRGRRHRKGQTFQRKPQPDLEHSRRDQARPAPWSEPEAQGQAPSKEAAQVFRPSYKSGQAQENNLDGSATLKSTASAANDGTKDLSLPEGQTKGMRKSRSPLPGKVHEEFDLPNGVADGLAAAPGQKDQEILNSQRVASMYQDEQTVAPPKAVQDRRAEQVCQPQRNEPRKNASESAEDLEHDERRRQQSGSQRHRNAKRNQHDESVQSETRRGHSKLEKVAPKSSPDLKPVSAHFESSARSNGPYYGTDRRSSHFRGQNLGGHQKYRARGPQEGPCDSGHASESSKATHENDVTSQKPKLTPQDAEAKAPGESNPEDSQRKQNHETADSSLQQAKTISRTVRESHVPGRRGRGSRRHADRFAGKPPSSTHDKTLAGFESNRREGDSNHAAGQREATLSKDEKPRIPDANREATAEKGPRNDPTCLPRAETEAIDQKVTSGLPLGHRKETDQPRNSEVAKELFRMNLMQHRGRFNRRSKQHYNHRGGRPEAKVTSHHRPCAESSSRPQATHEGKDAGDCHVEDRGKQASHATQTGARAERPLSPSQDFDRRAQARRFDVYVNQALHGDQK